MNKKQRFSVRFENKLERRSEEVQRQLDQIEKIYSPSTDLKKKEKTNEVARKWFSIQRKKMLIMRDNCLPSLDQQSFLNLLELLKECFSYWQHFV